MDVINITNRKRETYEIKLEYSLLWETALGIAAITNKSLINTLELSKDYLVNLKSSLSEELIKQLKYVEENNTWKALLQILHMQSFKSMTEFTAYIEQLSSQELKYISLPFTDYKTEETRVNASHGEEIAIAQLKSFTANNEFLPNYIDFICNIDEELLKEHLINVMTRWHNEVIEKDDFLSVNFILRNDYESKRQMLSQMSPEDLVKWATGGINYLPEPSVRTVLLIPQFIYRPWNIEADIEGTKVFYYPVANESINPSNRYVPDNSLVLKHKALGDEVRLRIVKLLNEKELTLQEITEKIDLGKSTIHHHLKILRSARIVSINNSKYCLEFNALESLSIEFERFLNK